MAMWQKMRCGCIDDQEMEVEAIVTLMQWSGRTALQSRPKILAPVQVTSTSSNSQFWLSSSRRTRKHSHLLNGPSLLKRFKVFALELFLFFSFWFESWSLFLDVVGCGVNRESTSIFGGQSDDPILHPRIYSWTPSFKPQSVKQNQNSNSFHLS